MNTAEVLPLFVGTIQKANYEQYDIAANFKSFWRCQLLWHGPHNHIYYLKQVCGIDFCSAFYIAFKIIMSSICGWFSSVSLNWNFLEHLCFGPWIRDSCIADKLNFWKELFESVMLMKFFCSRVNLNYEFNNKINLFLMAQWK